MYGARFFVQGFALENPLSNPLSYRLTAYIMNSVTTLMTSHNVAAFLPFDSVNHEFCHYIDDVTQRCRFLTV
jgi:hypothetical protein